MTDHDPFGLRSLTVDQLQSTPGVKWQQHRHRLQRDLAAAVVDGSLCTLFAGVVIGHIAVAAL